MPNQFEVLEKCRRALIAVVATANVGTDNIFNAKASEDKAAPLVGCDANNGREEPVNTGNFWVDLVVEVKTIGSLDAADSDPKTPSDTLVANVIAALEVDDLAAQLSAGTTDFTVFGFGEEKELQEEIQDDVWITRWMRRAYVCGSSF